MLELAPSKPWLAEQDDTLVAAGHRGHRLGMLVKIANLRRLAELPRVERVTTFNAAENEHMLAINVALGFRPAGWDGEWQRSVTARTCLPRRSDVRRIEAGPENRPVPAMECGPKRAYADAESPARAGQRRAVSIGRQDGWEHAR